MEDKLAKQITLEMGKTITDSLTEMDRAITTIKVSAMEALNIHGEVLHSDISSVLVQSLMNNSPTVIESELTLKDAVELMENGMKKVSVLPVINNEKLFGVLRLHDILSVSF